MPSAPNLGAFDQINGPIPFEYGKWSAKWETSELRYEPPHRPLVRLSARKQTSVREMQSEMRQKEKQILSDPTSTYRLPGFNNHLSRSTPCLKSESIISNTSFQTPQELESMQLTKSLNKLSSKPFKKIVIPKGKGSKKFQFSVSTGGSGELQRILINPNNSTISGNTEVESYVSELRKQVDPGLSPSPSMNNVEQATVLDQHSTALTPSMDKTHSLFYLEAEGSSEVWIPSGRMPSKPERFATYPSLSMRREGLLHKVDSSSRKQSIKIWPLDIGNASVTVSKAHTSPRKAIERSERVRTERVDSSKPVRSRKPTQERERVYPNMLDDSEGVSLGELTPGTSNRVIDPQGGLAEGSMIITPSHASLSPSRKSNTRTLESELLNQTLSV